MSWDASLSCDSCHHTIGDWSYIGNTSPMLSAARAAATGGEPVHWAEGLDGATGPEGKRILDDVIAGLKSDPNQFRKMNPANGWGNYDSVLRLMLEMSAAVPEAPTHWWWSC